MLFSFNHFSQFLFLFQKTKFDDMAFFKSCYYIFFFDLLLFLNFSLFFKCLTVLKTIKYCLSICVCLMFSHGYNEKVNFRRIKWEVSFSHDISGCTWNQHNSAWWYSTWLLSGNDVCLLVFSSIKFPFSLPFIIFYKGVYKWNSHSGGKYPYTLFVIVG